MNPVEPIDEITNNDDMDIIRKLNELIQAHNELLTKYESHTHPVMRTDDVYEDSLVTEIPQP